MGARGGGVTPTPSSSAAPRCLCRCCLCCRLSLSSIVSLWLPLSAPAQLSAPACVPASKRVSEGASAAPPRRAAPAAPLSMCSGAHPVLNNSGHVNSVSPSGTGTGGRSQAREGKSPTLPQPRMEIPGSGVLLKLSRCTLDKCGGHGQPSLGPTRERRYAECSVHSSPLFLDHTPRRGNQPHLLATLTPDSSLERSLAAPLKAAPSNSL